MDMGKAVVLAAATFSLSLIAFGLTDVLKPTMTERKVALLDAKLAETITESNKFFKVLNDRLNALEGKKPAEKGK